MSPGFDAQIERAVLLLRQGDLVAFPTETVYGLGADAGNRQAVARIFAAKGRPADHPLIVHLAAASALGDWAREIPPAALSLADAFWPGPLTLILKRAAHVSDAVTGGQDTVGLRVPDHPLALQLLAAFGGGLAAPSANRYGRVSPTTADHVRSELGEAVAMVLDGGPCAVGIESTIVDLSRGKAVVLRPGAIGCAQLARALGTAVEEGGDAAAPRVPGSHAAHYAPATALQLVAPAALEAALSAARARGQRVAVIARREGLAAPDRIWVRAAAEPAGYAHDLYATLRGLDAAEVDLILVEAVPQDVAWRAVADRLRRAAAGCAEQDEP